MGGTLLNEVFTMLRELLDIVESIDGIDFAVSDKYGAVTSCTTNLGTGMRASVHIKVPNLTADGTDKKAKEVCRPLGLSVHQGARHCRGSVHGHPAADGGGGGGGGGGG